MWGMSGSEPTGTLAQVPSRGTLLTHFVATVATAVATVVATPTFCVATVATAGKEYVTNFP